jgi:hypothetical protein
VIVPQIPEYGGEELLNITHAEKYACALPAISRGKGNK